VKLVKERYRALYHSLPYNCWPKIMIIRGAANCVKWLNAFPPGGGISDLYPPRVIITGRPMDYKKHCMIASGSHVQAANQNNPTNTNEERTISGILLRKLLTIFKVDMR
jgi:hypothetical protein